MDYYGLLFATDLWGLTAGKVDQSVHCVGKSVTFVHWEVRSTAGGRLLSDGHDSYFPPDSTTFVPYCSIDHIHTALPFHSSLLIGCTPQREVEFQLVAAAILIGSARHTSATGCLHNSPSPSTLLREGRLTPTPPGD